jgi:hypothetical protein
LLQLTDSEIYSKRLVELRGLSAAVDGKILEARALREEHDRANKLLKEATCLLATQHTREASLKAMEAGLVQREQQSAAAAQATAVECDRLRAELAAEERKINDLKERIVAGRAALAEAEKLIAAEWQAAEALHRQLQDQTTLH